MAARAVVFERPRALAVRELQLAPPGPGEVLVEVEWTGISTGTEKLLWDGRMPDFPGMGYPLVPGYETVGRIACCGPGVTLEPGQRVFVSGARCFGEIRGLFGGAASRVVVAQEKVLPVSDTLQAEGVLLALAATAHHALYAGRGPGAADLIVGHGVLGRLIARLCLALGNEAPVVWETDPVRRAGASRYPIIGPEEDDRRDYRRIIDASGDSDVLDTLMQRLARRGEIVLAGFYARPLAFDFPPAFMREASVSVAAEWLPADLERVIELVGTGRLDLAELITHRLPADAAGEAYPTAFSDGDCLKMVLDWRPV